MISTDNDRVSAGCEIRLKPYFNIGTDEYSEYVRTESVKMLKETIYAGPTKNPIMHLILDVIPYTDEKYFNLGIQVIGKDWFNMPNCYIVCAVRDENIKRYDDNKEHQNRWEYYENQLKR